MSRALVATVAALAPIALAAQAVCIVGCKDVSRFSTGSGSFEGPVVKGSFVRSGVPEDARLCLTLDTDHLQDTPGTLTTSDGRFRMTPLRSIPQLWHDPLSTLAFGEGRAQNLVYVASPADATQEVFAVVSLMQDGDVEVRLLRGAPANVPDAGGSDAGTLASSTTIFAIFRLGKRGEPCKE